MEQPNLARETKNSKVRTGIENYIFLAVELTTWHWQTYPADDQSAGKWWPQTHRHIYTAAVAYFSYSPASTFAMSVASPFPYPAKVTALAHQEVTAPCGRSYMSSSWPRGRILQRVIRIPVEGAWISCITLSIQSLHVVDSWAVISFMNHIHLSTAATVFHLSATSKGFFSNVGKNHKACVYFRDLRTI